MKQARGHSSVQRSKDSPNVRLRWARLQRGWSLEELAAQITRSMSADGASIAGLSAETVRRWEIGERVPTATFRKHLVTVFDMTAERLGLLSADELALKPTDHPEPSGVGDRAPTVNFVAETVKQVLHLIRDKSSGRRTVMGEVISRAAAVRKQHATGASRLIVTVTTPKPPRDARIVARFASIVAAQRELYFTTDADVLLDAVLPQLRLGVDLLAAPHPDTDNVRALAGSVTQTALLAARMAFFDLAEVDLATDCFTVATDTVAVSGDHAMSAAVCGHHALVRGIAGEASDARAALDAAHAHVRLAPSPRLRSWLHCVSAEIAARTGNAKASLNHIRQAEQALATRGEDPEWLDFFDESRWAGFAGAVYLLAGKLLQAATHLREALGQIGEDHKQRSVLLLDLAVAQADTDVAEAAASAHQALDLLATLPYAAATTRLPQVIAALRDTPFAAELQDRIHTLPVVAELSGPSTPG